MNETLTVRTERVDDIPVLVARLERMNVPSLLGQQFLLHGSWPSLSIGWVAIIWLAHLLSEAGHRLNHVQPWAEKRLHTLRSVTCRPVQPLDLTDDRLASLLALLSHDAPWISFERALSRDILRVYDLRPTRVRVDSTTRRGYCQVTDDGLFQFELPGQVRWHLTPLTMLQQRLLDLLDCSPTIYARLATEFLGTAMNMSEP